MLKIFKSITFWTLLTGFLLTGILWYIQMWTEPIPPYPFPFNKSEALGVLYKKNLWDNKIQIGIIIGVLLFVIQLLLATYPKYRRNKKWVKSYLEHIIFEKFQGDLEHTRITVFNIKPGYSILHKYIWKCFFKNLITHIQKGLFLCQVKLIPNPFKDYLVIYTRRSNPHEVGTSTYFPIASSPEEVCGIASHSLYIGRQYESETNSIKDINIRDYKKIDDIPNRNNRKRVSDYMSANKIEDYNKLRSLHRLSNNVWANPIYGKNEKAWGVIVIDNESDGVSVFQNINKDLISYARILEMSLIHIN